VIRYDGLDSGFLLGFLVVQGANLCFALGQVGYRRLSAGLSASLPRYSVFGWFYLGALAVAVPAFSLLGNAAALPASGVQWGVLLWLGLVASGLGYFLWNLGATRVDAGALAIMNNALIPAGLLVNLVICNRDADLARLGLGGAIIVGSLALNEWWLKRRSLKAA